MNTFNPKVNFYFDKNEKWHDEVELLRSIVHECQLNEELKWGVPCYTFDKKNIVLIHDFKNYCALLFPKGALIKDEQQLLIQQTENVQAARQMRFTSIEEIKNVLSEIKAYIFEAIEIEKAGLKVEMKTTEEFEMVEELQAFLDQDITLKNAFEKLTSGRKRAYLLYFAQAKQSKTRIARIEKAIPNILNGKGWNEN